ncbi:hypothetical protein ACFU3J_25080 [Streptomyces sp. NPDC057411]|uniref:hypothetical protein n=1 Tax=unclassified Streptomyces TaxID=2593676 RepID=UPI00362F44DC
MPPEQQKLIEALERLIEETELRDSMWLLFPNPAWRRQVERYLSGVHIPSYAQLWGIVTQCMETLGVSKAVQARRLDELGHLADDAQAARRRDRRLARQKRT